LEKTGLAQGGTRERCLALFSLVTMLQVGADLPVATNVPLGYGHNYSPSTYIDGWVSVTGPADWSVEKAARLKARFER